MYVHEVLNSVHGDGLVELIPTHVCHAKDVNVEAILYECQHQEEKTWAYCKTGQMLSLCCAHIET